MSATLAHLAPVESLAGTEALCGYRLAGIPTDGMDVCPRCTEIQTTPGDRAMLVNLHTHAHEWESAGSVHAPGGYSPAYRCTVCGDEVTDIGCLRREVRPESEATL